jgi:hypothetical protein
MRYEVRWGNGYWKAFDTHRYTDVGMFELKKQAIEGVARLNARKR